MHAPPRPYPDGIAAGQSTKIPDPSFPSRSTHPAHTKEMCLQQPVSHPLAPSSQSIQVNEAASPGDEAGLLPPRGRGGARAPTAAAPSTTSPSSPEGAPARRRFLPALLQLMMMLLLLWRLLLMLMRMRVRVVQGGHGRLHVAQHARVA